MPTTMHSDDIVDLALRHGFVLTRHQTHRIIERGGFVFTIPSTGNCNAWVTQAVVNICHELDRRERGEKVVSVSGYPATVLYQGTLYAVAGQDAGRYRLQSLEDGTLSWVNKEDTEMPEVIETIEEAEAPAEHPQETAAAVADAMRPSYYDRAGNGPVQTRNTIAEELAAADPMKYWQLTTERLVRDLRDRIAKLDAEYEAKTAPLRQQADQLESTLAIVRGGEPPRRIVHLGTAPAGPKRPYTRHGGNDAAGRHFASPETKARARALWVGGAGVAKIYQELKGDVANSHTVQNWVTTWKRDAGIAGSDKISRPRA